jgi:hypothetical protein
MPESGRVRPHRPQKSAPGPEGVPQFGQVFTWPVNYMPYIALPNPVEIPVRGPSNPGRASL